MAEAGLRPPPLELPRWNHLTWRVTLDNLILLGPAKPPVLLQKAAGLIGETIADWSGKKPAIAQHAAHEPLPPGSVVLCTLDSLRKAYPEVETSSAAIGRVQFIDDHGFAIDAVGQGVFIVARAPRGVFNGAVYLRDFFIDGPKDNLRVKVKPTVRTPQMLGRPAYVCNIWGTDPLYTVKDYAPIFDCFAEQGLDRLYFWVSGHFPSKKFPQAYRWKDAEWDSTVDTRIGTVADIESLMRASQDLGMAFYLGGGLGAWTGTGNLTNKAPGTMKTGEKFAPGSLCPSNATSRKALAEYYTELFDAFAKADGVYIELADEWGECVCPDCSKPVDEFGSRQFGQSQLSLIQEIMHGIWRKHPHARFAFTLGYDEHKSDPAFYEVVRQMSDERIEWMEARSRWEFSGPAAKDLPAVYFNKHVMRWQQYYNRSIDVLVADANRAGADGFYGLITSFEPGFASGSFYTEIPYPVHLLPYALTAFAFREMTWQPSLTLDALKDLARRRFFGADAPMELADDLFAMREVIRNWKKPTPEHLAALDKAEKDIAAAEPSATPKTLAGLALLRRAITDARKHINTTAS